MRTIRNFLLTQMPETIEADEDDDGFKKKEPIAKVFSTWRLEAITAALQHDKLAEGSKKHTNTAAMDAAKDLTHTLWGFDDNEEQGRACKAGNISTYKVAKTESSSVSSAAAVLAPGKNKSRQGRKLLFITADSRRSRQTHGSISCAMKGSRRIFEPRDLNPTQHKGKSFGESFSDAWKN